MNLILEIIALIINIVLLINNVVRIKKNLNIKIIVLLMFQAVYVVPILNNWIFGLQDFSYKFPMYQVALEDKKTNIVYCLFIIFVPLILSYYGNPKFNKDFNLKEVLVLKPIDRFYFVISFILMFTPIFLIIFAPDPLKYLTEYAYFQQNKLISSGNELWYHSTIMKIGGIVSLISILIVKYYGKNDLTNNLFIYTAAIITGILNGKRTLLAMILLGILVVDILKSKKGKFPFIKTIMTFFIVVIVFVFYANLIDKHTNNFSQLDDLRLYFFRDFDVKLSIYSILYPEEQKILQFYGQSFLYNIFFYIPREFWPTKPYPYAYYATSAALGYREPMLLPWTVQTSFYGELIANFSFLGIPVGIYLMNKFIDISEKSLNPLAIILCMFIVMFLFMNHFIAVAYYFLLWLIIIIFQKISKKSKFY